MSSFTWEALRMRRVTASKRTTPLWHARSMASHAAISCYIQLREWAPFHCQSYSAKRRLANGADAACGLRLEFEVGAGAVELAEPRPPQLQGLADSALPPAELLARLARCGLDLRPRGADAALVASALKVRRRGVVAGSIYGVRHSVFAGLRRGGRVLPHGGASTELLCWSDSKLI